MKYWIEEKVFATVGWHSLIGVRGKPPHSWGNYFWLEAKNIMDHGTRVLNFWAENLEAAKKRFLTDGAVTIKRYEDWCIIDDRRIPNDWYYNKLCFTGGGCPPVEQLKELYEYLGDPTNELEQFTDPESYYKKRGATYKNGTITYKMPLTVTPNAIILGA
jgi:hypothetical protein